MKEIFMFASFLLKRRYLAFLVFTVLMLVPLAGCGGSAPTSLVHPAATPSATTISGGNSATAILKHAPTGTAALTWNYTDHTLTVQMMLTGLAPNSVHPAHIHEGDCSQSGKILYPLIDVTADSNGVGRVTSKISVPNGIPASGWSIHVHNGPGSSDASQELVIACGNIVNQDTSLRSNQSAQVSFIAPADQDASGTARFTLDNHVLTVEINMTGLTPKTSHAAHIHAGSCTNQGKVLYDLPVITADANGKAMLTTKIQNIETIPANGWYVNVHRTTDLANQTGFDPIACGDVTLN